MGTATGPAAYTFRVEGTSNVIRSMRKSAPAHYLFEIEAFTAVKNSVPLAQDPYIQSSEFETSGYKWCRGDAMEKEKGIPKALPLNDFISSSNGFLKNDRCIFGIEVFATDTIARNARLSNLRRNTNSIYTWPFQEFSKLTHGECSNVFIWEGRPWRLQIYPRGWGQKQNAMLALYLVIQDVSDLTNGKKLFVEHELRVKNLLTREHLTRTIRGWYEKSEVSWGTDELLSLSDLHNSQKGFKFDDKVIVEAKLNQMMLVNDI